MSKIHVAREEKGPSHFDQHGFPAKHVPVSNGMFTEAMFLLNLAGRFAAHDVVRDEQNFFEGEMTQQWQYDYERPGKTGS
jgi:hypothetical protein